MLPADIPMPSIAQALVNACASGVDRLDAQLLLLQALAKPSAKLGAQRAWLLAHGEEEMPALVQPLFEEYVRRRAAGEPLAYITCRKEFFGLALHVDARVLVPRPDTETLVAWALELLAKLPEKPVAAQYAALDLGTGSGAIALALKHSMPKLHVDAVDDSLEALAVARTNAGALGLEIGFSHGSWLDYVSRRYHCIVSNPPYVAAQDPHLAALVCEPAQALVSGVDGLDDIRQIVDSASKNLYPGAWLLLEHGYDQAAAVRTLLNAAGYQGIASRRDLGGHERCSGGRMPGAIHCG